MLHARCKPGLYATQLAAVAMLFACVPALSAQTPVTDSSVQASPVKPPPPVPATDAAAQASPALGPRGTGAAIAPHTAVPVRLTGSIDSGHLTNGQTVHATLAAAVTLTRGGALPAGTPVALTVVETIPAGRISSAGEFSLEAFQVGSVPVYTDTLTYRGRRGGKDVQDAAPTVGTDAALPAGAELTFHVLPPAAPAQGPPRANGITPGSVDGVSGGSRPASPNVTPAGNTRPASSAQPR